LLAVALTREPRTRTTPTRVARLHPTWPPRAACETKQTTMALHPYPCGDMLFGYLRDAPKLHRWCGSGEQLRGDRRYDELLREPGGAWRDVQPEVHELRYRPNGRGRPCHGERLPSGQVPGHGGSIPPVRERRRGPLAGRGVGEAHAFEGRAGAGEQRRGGGGMSPGRTRRTGTTRRTNTAETQENLPINCVTWYEAAASTRSTTATTRTVRGAARGCRTSRRWATRCRESRGGAS
jgi:hypothetical protein